MPRKSMITVQRNLIIYDECYDGFNPMHESILEERMEHLSDTFSEYLLYLIRDKEMENADA